MCKRCHRLGVQHCVRHPQPRRQPVWQRPSPLGVSYRCTRCALSVYIQPGCIAWWLGGPTSLAAIGQTPVHNAMSGQPAETHQCNSSSPSTMVRVKVGWAHRLAAGEHHELRQHAPWLQPRRLSIVTLSSFDLQPHQLHDPHSDDSCTRV